MNSITLKRAWSLLLAILISLGSLPTPLPVTAEPLPAVKAPAATITVDTTVDDTATNGNCTLREAITAANTNAAVDACTAGTSGMDTITVPAGTYSLSAGVFPSIIEDLSITGAGKGVTLIDAHTASRFFTVSNGQTLMLSGLTLERGTSSGAGAIEASSAILHINASEILTSTNTSDDGGAISMLHGSGYFTDTDFIANGTVSNVGAIDASGTCGTLSIVGGRFERNYANSGHGGAIWETCATTFISGTTFITNTATASNAAGGALYIPGGTNIEIHNSIFQDNRAGRGGAVAHVAAAVVLNIDSTQFISNQSLTSNATGGGALHLNSGATAWMTNTDFIQNSSVDHGGAIFYINSSKTITLTNVDFYTNTAANGGGAMRQDGLLKMTGGIFQGNRSTDGAGVAGDRVDLDGVTFKNNTATGASGAGLNLGGPAIINNCSFTGNVAATVGGAFNTYSSATISNSTFFSNIAGTGGGAVEIFNAQPLTLTNSYFESNSSLKGGALFLVGPATIVNTDFYSNTATSTSDSTGGGGAIAGGAGVTVIDSDFKYNATNVLGTGLFINGAVNVTGGVFEGNRGNLAHALGTESSGATILAINASPVTISGTQFISNTSLDVTAGVYGQSAVTITNSYFERNGATYCGAAKGFPLYIQNSQFISNTASGRGDSSIGAACQAVSISNSLFQGNSSTYRVGAVYINGTATITNSDFISNTAGDAAGALFVTAPTTIFNSTFISNTSIGSGAGAIWGYSGTGLNIENSSFYHNVARTNFGGAVASEIPTTISNTTFYSNSAPLGGSAAGFTTGAVRLVNNTFSDNYNPSAGYATVHNFGASLTMINNIVANSLGAGSDCVGTVAVNTRNLIEDGTCSPALSGDPALDAPETTGLGGTLVFPLTAGSKAIDAGNKATAPAADQRGVSRPQGCAVDIGTYEKDATPCVVPMQNLVLWLDASDPDNDGNSANNPAGGAALPTWVDKSGSGNDAGTLAGQAVATYVTATTQTINLHPVVHFTRTNDSLGSAYNVPGVDIRAAANPNLTIFTIYRTDLISPNIGVWGNDNGAWDRFFLAYYFGIGDGVDDGLASLGPVGGGVLVPNAGQTNTVRLMAARYAYAATKASAIYFDGKVITRFTDSTDPSNAQTSLRIGLDGDNSAFSGDIAEVLVYNRALTDAEVCQISSALGAKYGRIFECTNPGSVGTPALWLKADVGVTGSPIVTGWTDQTGNNTFTVNGTPNISTTVNFNPVVTFNGTSDYLLGNSAITFTEAFLVGKTYGGLGRSLAGDGSTPSGCGAYFFASLAGNLYTGDADPHYIKTTSTDPGGYRVLNSTLNAGTVYSDSRLAVNGAAQPITPATTNIGPLEPFYRTPIVGLCGNRAQYYNGTIGEVFVYDRVLTADERQKIDSYLAIKYGITLSSTLNYVDSTGATLWDATANAGYYNDVAGIGWDSTSTLDQRKSIGAGAAAFVTIDNGGAFSANRSFLIWGHNNMSTDFNTIDGTYNRMARIWKVQETGTVNTVTLSISAFYGARYLLVDADGDFSSGATAVDLTADSNLTATYNFTSGQFFTFANDTPVLATQVQIQPAQPLIDQLMTATITISNTGGPATGVLVTMTVPAGMEVASIPDPCNQNGNEIVCGPVTMGTGPSDLIYMIFLTPTLSGPATLTTTTSADYVAPTTITTPITVILPTSMAFTKIAEATAPLRVGAVVRYTLLVTNTGGVTQTNLRITDTLPAGVVFSTSVPVSTTGPTPLIWHVASLAPGAVWQAVISTTVAPGTSQVGGNTASVSSDQTAPLTSGAILPPGGGSVLPQANVSLNLRAIYSPGTLSYIITISNTGPTSVTGAVVSDTFPTLYTGITWGCAATGGATCTITGTGNISDLVNLPVGGVLTYTTQGAMAPTAHVPNTATVTVPAMYDDNPADNSMMIYNAYLVIMPLIARNARP